MINIIQQDGGNGLAKCGGLLKALLLILVFIWSVRLPIKLMQFGLACEAQRDMLSSLMRRILSAPINWHEGRHSGDIASRIGQSTGAVFGFTFGQFALVESMLLMTGPIIALYILSPVICMAALGGYAALTLLCVCIDKYQLKFWTLETTAHRAFGTASIDFLRNMAVIYTARQEGRVEGVIGHKLGDIFKIARTNVLITECKWSGVDIISTGFALGLMVVYISLASTAGSNSHVALGNVYMVQAYVGGGIGALLSVIGNITTFMRQRTDFATAEPIYALEIQAKSGSKLPDGWRRLQCNELGYSYGTGKEGVKALSALNIGFERGCRYALVGRNGSGKSTLLKVLAGLMPPSEGALLVDGVPLDPAALRNSVTLVPQTPELLEGTISDNLFWDDEPPGSGSAQGRILDLLIKPLGLGLEAQVVEGGSNWSGGQRQRIAVARGLLAALESDLVLVDEPTSSIDAIDERLILDHLSDLFREKCLIVSLHNIDLLDRFDYVVVVSEGKIVGCVDPSDFRARGEYLMGRPEDATVPLLAAG